MYTHSLTIHLQKAELAIMLPFLSVYCSFIFSPKPSESLHDESVMQVTKATIQHVKRDNTKAEHDDKNNNLSKWMCSPKMLQSWQYFSIQLLRSYSLYKIICILCECMHQLLTCVYVWVTAHTLLCMWSTIRWRWPQEAPVQNWKHLAQRAI